MTLSGEVLGRGEAHTAGGAPTSYVLVIPTKGLANFQVLGREAARWWRTRERFKGLVSQGQLPWDVAKRAEFADNSLFIAAENLRNRICCSLFAQATDGRILGAMVYMLAPRGEATLNLLAVDPEHLAGSPGTAQLRGVGTAMVAAASRKFVSEGVERVNLHPLDREARLFWAHRGFGPCGVGGMMCIRGRGEIERLINGCQVEPDQGEVLCGLPERVGVLS